MTQDEAELEWFQTSLHNVELFGNDEVAAIKKSIYKWKLILRYLPTNTLIFSEVIKPCGLCIYYESDCYDCILGEDYPCYEGKPYSTVFNVISPLGKTVSESHLLNVQDVFGKMHLKYTIEQINDLKIKTIEYGEWLISYLTKELEDYDD